MSPYATVADLQGWADFYGVKLDPGGPDPELLLDLATRDVDRALGARWDLLLLEPEQVEALRIATAVQGCYRAGQGGEQALQLEDGLQAVGGVTFSTRSAARLSPEANEVLAGVGLFARSGTVDAL